MNAIIANQASMPFAVACLFALVLVGSSVWLGLTGFHPRWRRTIHWGRMRKGPPVSLAGHVIGAVAMVTWALWFIAYSIQIAEFTHFTQIVVGITSVALITILLHD